MCMTTALAPLAFATNLTTVEADLRETIRSLYMEADILGALSPTLAETCIREARNLEGYLESLRADHFPQD